MNANADRSLSCLIEKSLCECCGSGSISRETLEDKNLTRPPYPILSLIETSLPDRIGHVIIIPDEEVRSTTDSRRGRREGWSIRAIDCSSEFPLTIHQSFRNHQILSFSLQAPHNRYPLPLCRSHCRSPLASSNTSRLPQHFRSAPPSHHLELASPPK